MKEKALRETQIRSMREMGEMTRAQELRVDELSVLKLRESHETKQRLTSQVQESQERMNYLKDSGEFHNMTNSFLHHLFLCWKVRFRSQATASSDFPLESNVRDQRGGDGRFNA